MNQLVSGTLGHEKVLKIAAFVFPRAIKDVAKIHPTPQLNHIYTVQRLQGNQ